MEKSISFSERDVARIAQELKLTRKEFEGGAKVIVLIKMYNMGKASPEVAAEMLGLKPFEFLKIVDRYNASPNKSIIDECFTLNFENE